MPRNNADFHGITFRYEREPGEDHKVVAEHPSAGVIGHLTWADHDYEEGAEEGQITDIHVHPEWRRKGIATKMMEFASKINIAPPITHSPSRTALGEAWAKSTPNYYEPDEIIKLAGY